MKLCIRAHDLGVTGTEAILRQLETLHLDGVQMVCYKAYENIPYAVGGLTQNQAEEIGQAFHEAEKCIPLVGAYFNPVHSDAAKVQRGIDVFADYLRRCQAMGCDVVGSETGSYNDEPWIYHPRNRTPEALQNVAATFSQLCDVAADCGSTVALEGAAGHVCWDVATLAKVRKMIGRPTKVIFDLFNYMDAGNQGDYLRILDQGLETFAGEILLFHMKDCRLINGAAPQQVPLGTGDLDMREILKRIRAYDENAVLMLEGTTGADIPRAVQTIDTIWKR
jgi:sugar phosphate isomerase/epimerase